MNLGSINRDMVGRCDTDSDAVALHRYHGHSNVTIDYDFFARTPG
jgi:hypothetical protein